MKTNPLEVIIGTVVLAVAICFVVFAYSTSQWQSQDGYEVTAKFDRIDGVVKGTDVKLSGVKIGSVSKIRLDPENYLAIVTLTIAPTIQLPKDSSVEIISESLLGGKFLAIIPGADEEIIPPGGEILYTQAAVSLEALIGKFIFSLQEKNDDKSPAPSK